MGKINGENAAGAALLLFASLFLAAGAVNSVIASVAVVFYIIVTAGAGLVVLGYRTYRHEMLSTKEMTIQNH